MWSVPESVLESLLEFQSRFQSHTMPLCWGLEESDASAVVAQLMHRQVRSGHSMCIANASM